MSLQKLKKLAELEKTTLDKINDLLFQRVNAPSSSKTPSHKPSSLGYKCLRRLYYSYFRVPEDEQKSAKVARIFETGHIYESMLVGWIRQVDNFIDYLDPKTLQVPKDREGKEDGQFPIYSKKWKIKSGKIDGVGISNGKLWIYEIKSANSKNFKEVEKKKQPTDEHLIQGAIYLQTFNDLLKSGEFSHVEALQNFQSASGIKYFYINKDTSEVVEFSLSLQDMAPVILLVDKKISQINSFIDSKALPPKNIKECFFCPYKSKCGSDWNDV